MYINIYKLAKKMLSSEGEIYFMEIVFMQLVFMSMLILMLLSALQLPVVSYRPIIEHSHVLASCFALCNMEAPFFPPSTTRMP